MIETILAYSFAIILPVYFGSLVLKFWYLPLLFRIFAGFFVGFGFLSFTYFLLAVFGQTFSILPVILFMIFAIVNLKLYQNKTGLRGKVEGISLIRDQGTKWKWINFLLFSGIIFIAFTVTLEALTFPIYSWDAISTHAFKIKVFFMDQSPRYIGDVPHAAYPLYLPLSVLWLLQNIGFWHDHFLKGFVLLSSLSFLSALYYFLRVFVNQTLALLGIFILMACPHFALHMGIVYLDLSLAIFNAFFFMALIFWHQKRLPGGELLCALFSSLTLFVKMESLVFVMVQTIIFMGALMWREDFTFKEKIKKVIVFLSIVGMFFSLLMLTKWWGGIPLSERSAFHWPHGEEFKILKGLGYYFIREMFAFKHWNVIWIVWVFSLLIYRKSKSMIIFNSGIILILLAYACMGFFNEPVTRHLASPESFVTLPRFYLQIFPLVVISLILGYRESLSCVSSD